tara:strand:- start:43 stop:426 length:384 start_codon:yes stop_codon:yes gene_type:complete
VKSQIKKICSKTPGEESCGFLIFNKKTFLHPCENKAHSKEDSFKISTKDYLKALTIGDIFGIYHSHIKVDEDFSEKDIESSEELMLPYFVYSLKSDSHNLYIPKDLSIKTKSFKSFLYRVKKEYSVN